MVSLGEKGLSNCKSRHETTPAFLSSALRRAVAQVVARFLGVEEVAGSSPAGPTSKPRNRLYFQAIC